MIYISWLNLILTYVNGEAADPDRTQMTGINTESQIINRIRYCHPGGIVICIERILSLRNILPE